MGRSTLGRDYDIGRTLEDFRRRIAALERAALMLRYLFTPGVAYDTGWVSVPAAVGFTSSLEVRRIGHSVTFRGALTPAANWGAANALNQAVDVGGIPAQFRSPVSLGLLSPTTATVATTVFRVAIGATGGIQVRCSTATFASAVNIHFTHLDS